MTTKNLGRIRMNPRGVIDPLLAYSHLDLVSLNEESWIAKGNVPAGTSPVGVSENAFWQRLFSGTQIRGDLGETPAQGKGALPDQFPS